MKAMLNRVVALVIKELLALLRDSRSRFVLLGAADHPAHGVRLRGYV